MVFNLKRLILLSIIVQSGLYSACSSKNACNDCSAPTNPEPEQTISYPDYSGEPIIFVRDKQISPLNPNILNLSFFSVFPDLPAGLSLNSENGTISGIPSENSPEKIYTITGKNNSGKTISTIIKFKVIDRSSGFVARIYGGQIVSGGQYYKNTDAGYSIISTISPTKDKAKNSGNNFSVE